MNPTASAKGMLSPVDLPSDDVTPEEKLICLGNWLERTTLKEAQAAQACSILPVSALTIGTAFAGTFIGIDHRWPALIIFMVFVFGALVLFLYHHRRWTVWKAVAARLQTEQKLMIGSNRSKAWQKTGRHPPETLARWFDKQEPVRFLAGPALAVYALALVLGVLLMVFAVSNDDAWLAPKPATAAGSPPTDPHPSAVSGVGRAVF